MHGQGFPGACELGRGAIVVESLHEQVLHVAADVGDAPRVVVGAAEQHAGGERQSHAPCPITGGREVALEPDPRLHGQQVWVVREQRGSARGSGAGDDPCVRPLPLGARHGIEERARERAGQDLGWVGGQGREQLLGQLVSRRVTDPGPQQLHVPVARQAPREQHERRRPDRLVVGHPRVRIEHRVLERHRGHRCLGRTPASLLGPIHARTPASLLESVDPGSHPRPEPLVHTPRALVPGRGDAGPRPVEPHGAREPVVVEGALAEQLRQSSVGGAQREIELEQALAGRDHALREPQVVERGGLDVWHAPRIPAHGGRFAEPVDLDLAIGREQRVGRHRAQPLERIGSAHTRSSSSWVLPSQLRYNPA